ncbi:cyanophycinase [Nakamurella panacisegetis]|uniref:Cyanophycinase n=1 Tax=Nakamurella panacisegetis TaxID=1090615 RepID=A0A1H0KHA5_9ACTN|nr:hypothetical protein [Nakamurella panacisegetis]SDO55319.1 cyanophycinase [Nakamurella panacisegetis]
MSTVSLIGGGWSAPELYAAFVAESAGEIACVVIDEGDGADQFERWSAALRAAGDCRPAPVLVPVGEHLDVAALGDAGGLLVCGGLTPAYAAAVTPVASDLRRWLEDRPYCGFSAGAAIAGEQAVVGGWTVNGRPLIPEDAGEDLGEVTVVDGLALVPFLVDVHAGQWGTVPRLIESVRVSGVPGLAVDEDTAVTVAAGQVRVSGRGHAHLVRPGEDGAVAVTRYHAGQVVPVG